MKYIIPFLIVFAMCSSLVDSKEISLVNKVKIPTVGYFPSYFPRDLVEINTFHEHMLLGQVYETLVSTDRSGRLMPGVAKNWKFSLDGSSIEFRLFENKYFTNGKRIDAEDVKYSINRHIDFKKSQSNGYLDDVKEIKVIDKFRIKVFLKKPRIAIIKVLSREQLGIVPNGWTFNKKSKEPYIGSGNYRLILEENDWLLIANESVHKFPEKNIKKWKLIFKDAKVDKSNGELPTYLPFLVEKDVEMLEDEHSIVKKSNIVKQQSFVQTSFWKYPGSQLNEEDFLRSYSCLNHYVLELIKINKFEAATGVVPVGIMGYLKNRPETSVKLVKANKKIKVKVAVLSLIYDDIFNQDLINKVLNDYNIELEFVSVHPAKISEVKTTIRPDFIAARWAGGFNDPEGFMSILNKIINKKFEDYIGNLEKVYSLAIKEQDHMKRSQLFQEFGKGLITNNLIIPAWKSNVFYYLDGSYRLNNVNFRYSPRFFDVIVK